MHKNDALCLNDYIVVCVTYMHVIIWLLILLKERHIRIYMYVKYVSM